MESTTYPLIICLPGFGANKADLLIEGELVSRSGYRISVVRQAPRPRQTLHRAYPARQRQ